MFTGKKPSINANALPGTHLPAYYFPVNNKGPARPDKA
jgi:hypothetical protein